MTSWGDAGIFAVHVERDAAGEVAAVEIDLGDHERVRRLEALLDH